MAISYPLSLPTTVGMSSITLAAENAVAISTSPFTYKQQVIQHQGQRWTATCTLAPMKRQDAEAWVAFLLSLKGQYGYFLLGDPNCKAPQGAASTTPGTPVINGAGQTGDTLNIDGLPINTTGYLLPGDYIQLGSGATATLHKVLTQVNTNALGEATLDIWPNNKVARPDGNPVVINNCKGRFRLSSNVTQWEINNISSYGITFDCVEVI